MRNGDPAFCYEGPEDRMSERQKELMTLISKTIRYHLGLDEIDVTEAKARNVAAHLLLVVPEWREQLREAGEKGPKY